MMLLDIQKALEIISLLLLNLYFVFVFVGSNKRFERLLAAIGLTVLIIAFKVLAVFGAK